MKTALYPGSFDPPHNGHLDVIKRASALVQNLVVGVARETRKNGLFSAEDRVSMLEDAVGDLQERGELTGRVEVRAFDGLTVNYARSIGADAIVKGLRGVEDLEHEMPQAVMNRHLTGIETVFLVPTPPFAQVSSTLIREVSRLRGDVSGLVPSAVARRLSKSSKGTPATNDRKGARASRAQRRS